MHPATASLALAVIGMVVLAVACALSAWVDTWTDDAVTKFYDRLYGDFPDHN